MLVAALKVDHFVDGDQARFLALGRADPGQRRGCGRDRVRRQLPQQRAQGLGRWRRTGFAQGGLDLDHGFLQTLGAHRFEQVVQRRMLEGGHRILVVGADEHDMRWLRGAGQAFGQAKSRQAGHLDVEEHHIGRVGVGQTQRVEPVGGFGDDAQFGPGARQQRLQIVRQVRFVVGDQGAGLVDGGFAFKGRRRRTVMPLGWFSIN